MSETQEKVTIEEIEANPGTLFIISGTLVLKSLDDRNAFENVLVLPLKVFPTDEKNTFNNGDYTRISESLRVKLYNLINEKPYTRLIIEDIILEQEAYPKCPEILEYYKSIISEL